MSGADMHPRLCWCPVHADDPDHHPGLGLGDPERPLPDHGEWARYTHHGCRCDACKAENSARCRIWRETGSTVAPPAAGDAAGS